MKIWIVVAQEPIPELDPGARPFRCSMLASALIARGHDVVRWISSFDHVTRSQRTTNARTGDVASRYQMRFIDGPGYRRAISLARVRHNRISAANFASAARAAEPPDLIFASMPVVELAEVAVTYARSREVAVVVDVRDRWPDLYLTAIPPFVRPVGRLILDREFRRAARTLSRATGITAVSDSYLGWGLRRAGRPCRESDGVFPLGHPDLIADEVLDPVPQVPRDALIVTFAGSFGVSNDLITVIEAARRLRSRSDVWFVLAGDGDLMPALRDAARGLQRVVFTGWLGQEALSGLLRRSAVGLIAYDRGATQTLPNKPFEYWASALPVISSLRGELDELIRREAVGLAYTAGDPGALMNAVQTILDNEASRLAMGKRARSLFERSFSQNVVYEQLAKHLEAFGVQVR